ncbi:MAG: ParB/RepB/Spo0J family partition protein [Tissierellia bacterium]|jgi:ParB family chromosome partitioning protein|nr:ParB/RepB/Spo0J family partition protein [Tissierellia bacterium]MDD3225920.1 ParB/RepB/Spo0J family partition protein [Tissierellia bacterium]MDD3750741.1 ParB/RepB/Spo0J family partition protein [Tissierellia bacterium]MDD4045847.1 ParB/RepB/Spo0J family partition protein [Tissierellia bacterium]MDD4678035.1 ParB/RepB/Spo0J family partition protein [Tissierellia bacterium]
MSAKRKALGKGLSALIPEDLEKEDYEKIHEIDIDLISPNPNQPRKVFEQDKLDELTESIKKYGVIQPIILRKEGELYTIIAGERRWRACKNANIKTIPSIVRDIENRNASEIALIENIQREDLNPIDEANAYEFVMDRYGITQEQVSNIVGKSRVYVTNIIRLTNLDEYVKDKIIRNLITAGHGRAILSLEKEKQKSLTDIIIRDNLSVRDVEKLVRSSKKPRRKVKAEKDKYIVYLEELLMERFSARVNIKNKKDKGKIEIEYTGSDDLNRILEILKIED